MIIRMLDGREIDESELVFDPSTYKVTSAVNGENLTNNIRQSDKARVIPDFDKATDNERAYAEKWFREHGTQPPPPGSTSTMKIFLQQILTEPLQAPLESLNSQIEQATAKNPTVKILVGLAIAALVIYGLSTLTKAANVVKG
jgi:hypothetical protein